MVIDDSHWYHPTKPNIIQTIASHLRPQKDWRAYLTRDLTTINVVYKPRRAWVATIHLNGNDIIVDNPVDQTLIPLADPKAIHKAIKVINTILAKYRQWTHS